MKRNILKIVIFLIFSNYIYSQDALKEKMDSHILEVKVKWKFNPLRTYDTDKYLYGWLDPDAYNSKYWIGDIFNIENMYPNKKYNFDKTAFFHQPTLATEINPIAFTYKGAHRFRIGVGFLSHFFMSIYKPNNETRLENICNLKILKI